MWSHTPAWVGTSWFTTGNFCARAGQTHGARPIIYSQVGALTFLPTMVWAPEVPSVPWQSMAQPVVLSIPGLSQVPLVYCFTWAGVGCEVEKIFLKRVLVGLEPMKLSSVVKWFSHQATRLPQWTVYIRAHTQVKHIYRVLCTGSYSVKLCRRRV